MVIPAASAIFSSRWRRSSSTVIPFFLAAASSAAAIFASIIFLRASMRSCCLRFISAIFASRSSGVSSLFLTTLDFFIVPAVRFSTAALFSEGVAGGSSAAKETPSASAATAEMAIFFMFTQLLSFLVTVYYTKKTMSQSSTFEATAL